MRKVIAYSENGALDAKRFSFLLGKKHDVCCSKGMEILFHSDRQILSDGRGHFLNSMKPVIYFFMLENKNVGIQRLGETSGIPLVRISEPR